MRSYLQTFWLSAGGLGVSFRVLSSPGGTANVFILLDLTIENGISQRTKKEDFDILPSILNPTLEPFGRIFIELIFYKYVRIES